MQTQANSETQTPTTKCIYVSDDNSCTSDFNTQGTQNEKYPKTKQNDLNNNMNEGLTCDPAHTYHGNCEEKIEMQCKIYGILYEPIVQNDTKHQAENRMRRNKDRIKRHEQTLIFQSDSKMKNHEKETETKCNDYGILYEATAPNETKQQAQNRMRRNIYRIKKHEKFFQTDSKSDIVEKKTELLCRKYGVLYERAVQNETKPCTNNRRRRNNARVKKQEHKFQTDCDTQLPDPPPLLDNPTFDRALDCIRSFEVEQMSYNFSVCSICHERRFQLVMSTTDSGSQICSRCKKDTSLVRLFSSENIMDPGILPLELIDLTVVEEQLISRITPCINVHMLKHGGIAASGRCVTFPQEVDEPAKIFPRLPDEINILKVRKTGTNDSTKEFRVRRYKVQAALLWLKGNNPAYNDIIISNERLEALPLDGCISVNTFEYKSYTKHKNDKGPAHEQINPGEVDGNTHSRILLPDKPVDIR